MPATPPIGSPSNTTTNTSDAKVEVSAKAPRTPNADTKTPKWGGISVKDIPVVPQPAVTVKEVKPLTQDDLEQYWQQTAEELDLTGVMKNGKPILGTRPGFFEVEAQTVYFDDEFKKHRIAVLESIRDKTGMRMLDCKVNPIFVSKEEVLYSPDDKWNAMLAKHPPIAELRKLFPVIDY